MHQKETETHSTICQTYCSHCQKISRITTNMTKDKNDSICFKVAIRDVHGLELNCAVNLEKNDKIE